MADDLHQYVGRWARLIRPTTRAIPHVHPQDVRFLEYRLIGSFHCEASEGDFLVLRLSETVVLRVRPAGVELEDETFRFKIGDKVRVKATAGRTMRHGVIRVIDYHEKLGCPMYFLREGGREVKGRYFEQELEADSE
jgi:hypothetical protein